MRFEVIVVFNIIQGIIIKGCGFKIDQLEGRFDFLALARSVSQVLFLSNHKAHRNTFLINLNYLKKKKM